ncbi:uncharacterized protein LOC111698851 isoform X2 [Eurytemora carolleeae]|uniref:uncharacterized protein LOC111698851 isoform X2 n=1 Tax=Eurytemora carolleeae TaxID=1294199 RepID=UPI000C78F5D3|nr:uncharacterized protein LOC111698851 isoform X2 [Eurytemora carolleeae]|eukprot:XP_023325088.1 uncharacterized protein LOC111698851 isoform X2 [Eurytemora affinis]
MAEEEMMMSPEDASKLPSFHDTFSGSPQLVNTPLRFNDTGAVSSPSSDSSHGIQDSGNYFGMNLSTPMSGVLYTKPTHVFSTPISGGQQLISSLTDLSPIGANDFGHATQAAAGSIRFQKYWSVENPAQKYLSENRLGSENMETSSYGAPSQEDLTNLVSMNPSLYDGTYQEQYTEPVSMMIMNKEESFGSGPDLASPSNPAKPHKEVHVAVKSAPIHPKKRKREYLCMFCPLENGDLGSSKLLVEHFRSHLNNLLEDEKKPDRKKKEKKSKHRSK